MFTWDFISGEVKYFCFGVWSISYNCLHDTTRNKTRCWCYFIAVILTEMKFHFGWWNIIKILPEMKSYKRKHRPCVSKNDWLLLNRSFISGHPRNEIRFISPAMKSSVNRNYFMVDWHFVSGRRFHFRSHVNTP